MKTYEQFNLAPHLSLKEIRKAAKSKIDYNKFYSYIKNIGPDRSCIKYVGKFSGTFGGFKSDEVESRCIFLGVVTEIIVPDAKGLAKLGASHDILIRGYDWHKVHEATPEEIETAEMIENTLKYNL